MTRLTVVLFMIFPTFGFGQRFNLEKIKAHEVGGIQAGDTAKMIVYPYTIGVSEDYFPNRKNFY